MPASSFYVPAIYPGQPPDSFTLGPTVVFVDYSASGGGGDSGPTVPTTGQIWPRGHGT
jgi:hypothetical protein